MAEVVMALAVLAVAIPLTFTTLAAASRTGVPSSAETRCLSMVPICLDEIQASRNGCPQYFTSTSVGQSFPPEGDLWALAFSGDGRVIGKVNQRLYETGGKMIEGESMRYIATMMAYASKMQTSDAPIMNVRISIEYPASEPSSQRRKIDFFTRLP